MYAWRVDSAILRINVWIFIWFYVNLGSVVWWIMLLPFWGTDISKNSSERMYVKSLYLFRKLNNSCCNWAVQGQLSKCARRNTVTSAIKLLIKCHKDLKGTDLFSRRYFRKKLDWIFFFKTRSRETVINSFFGKSQSATLLKINSITATFLWIPRFSEYLFCEAIVKAAFEGIKSHIYKKKKKGKVFLFNQVQVYVFVNYYLLS